MAFAQPLLLWALPLALLPVLFSLFRPAGYPSLIGLPRDPVSAAVSILLRLAACLAIAAVIMGLAGPHTTSRTVERIGTGANIVLLIDRSESMNMTFAGRRASGEEETMNAASRRLLRDFVEQREHDQFGVAAFSTSAMPVTPLTTRRDAVLAAVDAMDRPGLAQTNIGQGLALAQAMFDDATPRGSRVIFLVSDGAAVIDPRVQERLRASFERDQTHIYWLFLRAANSRSIYDQPTGRDTPQAMPERHLNIFFESLGVPYQAFEAENAEAVEEAIAEIARLETSPLPYREETPRYDLTPFAYGIGLAAVLLLLAAKLSEVAIVPRAGAAAAQGRGG